jgi:hypothetical protein
MRTISATLCGALLWGGFSFGLYAQQPTAEFLLKESDRARGTIAEGVKWESDVTTIDSEGEKKVRYHVRVKGVDALAEAVAPARSKGETLLFNDRSLWFFRPGLKKPLAISPRQKLMGQAANGDIASTNYYRDYEGKLVGEDTVDGQPCYKLELKAKAKNVTYDGIRYWITKDSHWGVKAEFLTLSGDTFKVAKMEYKNKIKDESKKELTFISRMTITDALNPKNQTMIAYDGISLENLPDKIFNINNISR